MSVHQCPKCELRFSWRTELDDHLREEHPEFRHEYPVGKAAHPAAEAQPGDEPTQPHSSLPG
jgi:hypothetical protein